MAAGRRNDLVDDANQQGKGADKVRIDVRS